MQGCPGEELALKAYAAYKGCIDGQTGSETSTCCKNDHRSQTDKEGDHDRYAGSFSPIKDSKFVRSR